MPKKAVIDAKSKIVDQVADEFSNAVSAIAVDSRGLSVEQDTKLRKELRDSGVKLQVIKNKVLARATKKAGVEGLDDIFKGPTAIAFSDEDPVAPAKVLKNFADDNDTLTIKGGIIENKVASIDEINAFAALPGRDELLATLANILQAPVRDFAYAVKAVADDKPVDDAAEDEAKAEKPADDAKKDEAKPTEDAKKADEKPADEAKPAEDVDKK